MKDRESEKIDYETAIYLFKQEIAYLKRRLSELKTEAIAIEGKINTHNRMCAHYAHEISVIDAEK